MATADLCKSRSRMKESTKTETPMVWPGPVKAAVRMAKARIRHPAKERAGTAEESGITGV